MGADPVDKSGEEIPPGQGSHPLGRPPAHSPWGGGAGNQGPQSHGPEETAMSKVISNIRRSQDNQSHGPTQATKRATGAPQGDSFPLRRGFGSASACIISPVMKIVNRFLATTYKPGERTGCPLTPWRNDSPYVRAPQWANRRCAGRRA